jgi:aminopeptidase
VFGEPDVDRLWDAVSVAMRLDEPDVVLAWREHTALLQARARALESLDLDSVRYVGEGTDLTVGLVPGCRWVSGSIATTAGVDFMPNLPTEEVFTSPDRRRADGTIRLTRPLVMPRAGVLVEGLVVRFEGGRIVDVSADAGVEAVRAELDVDEGARSLGEVSLVDGTSKVREAGVVFHDTLYDENAGCHVAWGEGFAMAVPDGRSMDRDTLFEIGINTSAVHTDVVIGGPGVDVSGTTRDGRVVPIITDDAWVLPVG